mgnify:CR=1 FL=1
MLRVLIAIALFGTEVLKTTREMLAVSLRTPRKRAELSSAKEEVPGASNVPSRVFVSSKADSPALHIALTYNSSLLIGHL